MSFADVIARTWRDNLLFSVLLELTYRCNLDCFFCYNDLGLAGRALTREEYFQLFEDLAAMQVLNLTFSGGEPLAHPDFLLLGAKARELGFVVRIKSNGHALRGELLRRLRDEVDPFIVEVSLHGATAATHDRQTRVPGSFERLLANLNEMGELGFRIKINSTLTAWNEGEIEGMFDLVESLGAAFQVDPEVSPKDDGDRGPLSIAPTREGMLRLFAVQEERARLAWERANRGEPESAKSGVARGADDETMPVSVHKHCGAGSAGIAVDPYGNVYPCVQWRRPVGNLHERRIGEIWAQSTGLKEVREITAAAKGVVEGYGASGPLLNFCPGNADAHTGDPLTVYPSALRRMELAEESVRSGSKKTLLPIVP
ncbi:MAG TPA: radical SAM protein [Thermoanaerobaculia bacterium]|nr:radical SAM protein [Thermoanaerobaculia bacterium]